MTTYKSGEKKKTFYISKNIKLADIKRKIITSKESMKKILPWNEYKYNKYYRTMEIELDKNYIVYFYELPAINDYYITIAFVDAINNNILPLHGKIFTVFNYDEKDDICRIAKEMSETCVYDCEGKMHANRFHQKIYDTWRNEVVKKQRSVHWAIRNGSIW